MQRGQRKQSKAHKARRARQSRVELHVREIGHQVIVSPSGGAERDQRSGAINQLEFGPSVLGLCRVRAGCFHSTNPRGLLCGLRS